MDTKAFVVALLVATRLEAAPLADQIDKLLKPYVQFNTFSGVILAARGDKVVFQKAYGSANAEFAVPNTMDTRFAIASITKRFTSVIMQKLYDAKALSPDDPLSKWVPDFPSADAITLRMLQTHRSGVRDPDNLRGIIRQSFTAAEAVDRIKINPLGSKPGEVYSYTTANYAILADVIEKVTGKTYAQMVREWVYEPAGMKNSGELTTNTVVTRLATGYMPNPFGSGLAVCGPEDTSWKVGGGSSYSTAADLHRFVRALYGGKLLPKDEVIASWQPAKVLGRNATSLSGSFPGASANVLYFIDDGVAVIVLSNNYASVPSTIAESIASIMFDQPVNVPSIQLAADAYAADSRLTGSYRVEGRPWTFTIAQREGRDVVTWTPVRRSMLLRKADGTWFEPLDFGTFEMKFDANGKFVDGTFEIPSYGKWPVLKQ